MKNNNLKTVQGFRYMATYAIGDIQGCYLEFMDLLTLIQFNPTNDTLWLAGDLINRGPQSLDVLQFIINLGDKHITVLGNHDLHFLAVAMKCQTLRPHDTFQDILRSKDLSQFIDWMRTRKLLHSDPQLNFVLAHAGIYPLWGLAEAQQYANEVENILAGDKFQLLLSSMYGNLPDLWSDSLIGWDRYRFITNTFARMRYCTIDYRLNMKEKSFVPQTKGLFPWFAVKNRKDIPADIVFGHWASLNGITSAPRVFAIDTGCSWGHRLTALRLEDKKLFSVISTFRSKE